MLIVKPWWLKFTAKSAWVTIYPKIYYPEFSNPLLEPEIVAHEEVHLNQQFDMGLYKWLFKYIVSKQFRLDQEAKAIAVEVLALPDTKSTDRIEQYSNLLAGKFYHKAAPSVSVAKAAIWREILLLTK